MILELGSTEVLWDSGLGGGMKLDIFTAVNVNSLTGYVANPQAWNVLGLSGCLDP